MKTKSLMTILSQRAKRTLLLFSFIGLVGVVPATLRAATASEKLEQGIYSEETKGDLDSAMKLYEQVVIEAKASEALAAQAQYRLGVCLYKKKSYTQATAAFEKLVKDYPNQKEYVQLANEYLAGAVALLPAPWVDGEDLRFDIKFPSGYKVGMARYTADAAELNGRKIWRLSSFLYAGIIQCSRVEVEADSFKPIHCRWKHTLLGDSETTYSPGQAELKLKNTGTDKTIKLDGVCYDNEECLELMRRLPLDTNYTTTLRIFAGLAGGQIIPIGLSVDGLDTVTTPAGTFDCYKVQLSIKQSFWYSTDEHRYLVKFEGGGIVAELSEISHRKPDEPVTYSDESVSLSAPAGWMFFPREAEGKANALSLMIFDPDATATTQLNMQSLESLSAEDQKSVRAWAEQKAAAAATRFKDFKIRTDSWKELTMAGRPAVSLVADGEAGSQKNTMCGVYTFVNGKAAEIWFATTADDFEGFLPKFNGVVDSLKMK